MRADYVTRILRSRVYDVAVETPVTPAPRLSKRLGRDVLLKREDLQPVFSFKLRGAYNRMASLTPDERARGVVAASAGNHAQGVALAAQRLGTNATLVMPEGTARIKVEAVAARGARTLLEGACFDDAQERARHLAKRDGLAFIHPYDDPDVIAGQGTVGMEILRQAREIGAIFVPVGGGGLLAGVAAFVKHLRPEVRVVGVEPDDADAMSRSLAAGRRVRLESVGLFADGVAVKEVGRETFRLCRELVDEILVVTRREICAAIRDVFEETRAVLEPAGALALAGLKSFARDAPDGPPLVAIASGANIDFERLAAVAEGAGRR